MQQNSRHIFFEMLKRGLSQHEFKARLSALLDYDPFFVPGYLEHLWLAECDGENALFNEIIGQADRTIWRIYTDKSLQERVTTTWSQYERNALFELLQLQKERSSFLKSFRTKAQMHTFDHIVRCHTNTTTSSNKFLCRVADVDSEPLMSDVQRTPPYWWNVYTARTKKISYHQHTHAILLREINDHSAAYTPVDGVHESLPLPYVERFKNIHNWVLEFAQAQNLALGRVVLVRLEPWRQVYRHYDLEESLYGRLRYHLVLQAGVENILSAGSDTVFPQTGQLWHIANDVMHRAHNKSDTPRIHLVFDGYPLEGNGYSDES